VQDPSLDPVVAAAAFFPKAIEIRCEENSVDDAAGALAGARDILAERMADDAIARGKLRELFAGKAVLKSKSSPEGGGGSEVQGLLRLVGAGRDCTEPSHSRDPSAVKRRAF
jgi:transcriptional accessory protein Tex/SPT6